jgi:hypothetical protein
MSTPVGAHSHPDFAHLRSLTNPNLTLPPHAIGFTRRIVGVPKAESDAILAFLFAQLSQNHDFQVRFKWEPNDVAIWDNRASFRFSSPPFHNTASTFPALFILSRCVCAYARIN